MRQILKRGEEYVAVKRCPVTMRAKKYDEKSEEDKLNINYNLPPTDRRLYDNI